MPIEGTAEWGMLRPGAATDARAEGLRPGGITPGEVLADLLLDQDEALHQLAEFLGGLPVDRFALPNGEDAAIGEHVRHILDHYTCLVRGTDGTVDYTERCREPTVGRCRDTALERIARARTELAGLAGVGRTAGEPSTQGTLRVRYHPGGNGPAPAPHLLESSLERELMFALSHTIHHMALIAVLARQAGIPVPPGFGVAPSTRRHRG